MLTTINPDTHHYNGSPQSLNPVNIADQLIEPAMIGNYPPASAHPRQAWTFSMSKGIPRRFSSIRNASAKTALSFEVFSLGFAIEHPEITYRLLGDPHIKFHKGYRWCTVTQRVEMIHTYEKHEGATVRDIAVVTASMLIYLEKDRQQVVDFLVGAEMLIMDDGTGYLQTLTGVDCQKALGQRERFAIFPDEMLHMYLKCDDRVFTPMCADKELVERLVESGWAVTQEDSQ